MRFALLAVVLSALLPALGWQQPNSTTANSVQKCEMSGTVVDATSGQPLRGAQIALGLEGTGDDHDVGLTDGSGRFEIKNIPPGRYKVWANHTGYISMQYGQRNLDGPGQTLTLSAGQNVTDISFRLPREAVITGHVYDENGDPIQGAQADAFIYGYSGGKRQLALSQSATTDDRGEFRLFDLAPGMYYVRADVGPAFASGKSAMSYSPTYYPGVVDASTASPITVRAGDEFPSVDFALQKVATFHVRGRVVVPAAMGSSETISVQLFPKYQSLFSPKSTDAKGPGGDFDLSNVRPGSYELIAWMTAGGRGLQASQPVLVVDSDVNDVNLVLMPAATLRGHIEVEGTVDMSNIDVDLEPQGLAMYGISGSQKLPGGNFEFQNLMAGSYRVELSSALPPNAYLKSASLDGRDVLESGFDFVNGQGAGSMLNIVVSAHGGRISGVVVLDGRQSNNARVTLAPADESKLSDPLWVKDAVTDQNGNFLIQGLRPGKYRVFAWQDFGPGQDHDPELLKRFRDRGYEVQVSENSAQTLQLNAIPDSESLSDDGR